MAMQRVALQRLARLSLTCHAHASAALSSPVAAQESTESAARQGQQIVFPREGLGVNYALNWALCAKGVTPKGEAYRNLRESQLKKLNASIPEPTETTTVYARGSYTVGATDISKAHFNRLYKEVTASLTSAQKLYVHDGAVGSSPLSDAKVRTISDNPSSALLFRSILEPASTHQVSHQEFPFTVYVASNYSPSDFENVGLTVKDKKAFVVIDYDRSAMILGASAFTDVETIKKALAALTAPSILSRDALPLSARLLVQGGATVLVFAPEPLILKNASLLKAAVSPDLGLVWSKEGVARLFANKGSGASNLYKAPASVVLVTADSTGAVPEISKVTPEKAGALFVAGYNGDEFQPGYQAGPGSVDPVELAKGLTALLESTNTPAFLVNASVLAEKDLQKYIESTVTDKLPKSKGKKPSESAGTGQSSAARVSGSSSAARVSGSSSAARVSGSSSAARVSGSSSAARVSGSSSAARVSGSSSAARVSGSSSAARVSGSSSAARVSGSSSAARVSGSSSAARVSGSSSAARVSGSSSAARVSGSSSAARVSGSSSAARVSGSSSAARVSGSSSAARVSGSSSAARVSGSSSAARVSGSSSAARVSGSKKPE